MRVLPALALVASALLLGSCTQDTLEIVSVQDRVAHPLPPKMQEKLRKLGLSMSSPTMMRIFKEEEVLEVWKADSTNRYKLVATYPICAWSGQLGPKKKEGDRQAPEGFYNITPGQMNPNSSYYLSFDIGYPNKFDRAYGRSGSNLMVHGACSSAGCYSMSDAAVLQIYAFAREAFKGGQKSFQIQAYPFRMTAENMAKHRFSPHYDFWQNIKTGYDHFEITKRPPEVDVCEKKYVFNQVTSGKLSATGKCPPMSTPPALASAYTTYSKSYETAFQSASAKWGASDWKDIPEFDRKAADRLARRKGKTKNIPNDADYVIVDPKAKITPTSDTVTSYSAAYAKIQARKAGLPPQVEYISVAELEARKKAEEAKRKEDEKLAKQLAKAKVPVPEANPLKPAVTAEVKEESPANPIWSLFAGRKVDEPKEATAPVAAETTAATAGQTAHKPEEAKASKKTNRSLTAEPEQAAKPAKANDQAAAVEPTVPAQEPAAKKPFWKIW
ncbi:MAG: hypothetical protein RLZZ444_1740 [Pseudomonadota bacterium]